MPDVQTLAGAFRDAGWQTMAVGKLHVYPQRDRNKTIQLGIQMFTGIYSTEYGLIMATSVLAIIPVLVVFLAFQRFFVEGIASSGLKG